MQFSCPMTNARIETITHNIQYILFVHGTNDYANASQWYVILH